MTTATAILGNGCFWCTEAVFSRLKGVLNATSGYSGGQMDNPGYEAVCSGETGHAECLEIIYDQDILSFQDLLKVFFMTHDPTTLNRQGNDEGTQYRSVIFYKDEKEKKEAATFIANLEKEKRFLSPIVTTLEPFQKFYPAEDYHRQYFELHGTAPYCQFVVRPKVEKFIKAFRDKLK